MKLITEQIERRLLDNARSPDEDHWPVVKFYDPSGPATWLIHEHESPRPRHRVRPGRSGVRLR